MRRQKNRITSFTFGETQDIAFGNSAEMSG